MSAVCKSNFCSLWPYVYDTVFSFLCVLVFLLSQFVFASGKSVPFLLMQMVFRPWRSFVKLYELCSSVGAGARFTLIAFLLCSGHVPQNEAVRDELQTIVDGLQGYLRDVTGRADRQRAEYDALLDERRQLLEHMQELEADRHVMQEQQLQLSQLQDVSHVCCLRSC